MAEVARLHTLSADKAKGDFISSISHELRSPLHGTESSFMALHKTDHPTGVLASAEFLSETSLDGFQTNLVDTITSCGRMLLDTINHVLDFSKLSVLMREQDPEKLGLRSVSLDGRPKGVVSLIEAVDISAIVEQVIETVYAGFEVNRCFPSSNTIG